MFCLAGHLTHTLAMLVISLIRCLGDSVTEGTRHSHSTLTGITGAFTEPDESLAWSKVLDDKEDDTIFKQVQREGIKAQQVSCQCLTDVTSTL